MNGQAVADNTPILVGAGQVVERGVTDDSPLALAAEAARRALAHAGGSDLVAAIDTISVTRLFTDSMGMPPCPFGRSDNPPMSVARAIGAEPAHCIYGLVGGTEPQSRIIEFAGAIARGERSVVLLAGAEAIRNQRNAQRDGRALDWSETFDKTEFPLDDRGWCEMFVTMQEVHNGLLAPVSYYALIEQARAFAAERSTQEQQLQMARLLLALNKVATSNPYAQFPATLSTEDILGADLLNHLYTKRMVAQDGVNQGAALLMCSVGAARRLGIPREHWVFIHGLAEGADVNLSEREDLGRSMMAERVLEHELSMAARAVDEIELIDLYSCFPCAVSSAAEALGLPVDGSRTLTLTGGLAYFGGAGNNYSMHALAEAVSRLRESPEATALVAALGGFLSKHAVGVYSCQPSSLDCAKADTTVKTDLIPRRQIDEAPQAGFVQSHVVNYKGGAPVQAVVLAETVAGKRFVANATDPAAVAAVLAGKSAGLAINVTAGDNGALHFMPA